MIPKRIIQTWKTKKVPGEFRSYQKRLRKLNPDYEFLLFTDEEVIEFVKTEYPQYFDAFSAFPEFIYKVDLFRLLAVHKLGGIYLDLDVYPVKAFDEVLRYDCVFPQESVNANPYFALKFGMTECIGQYAFGSIADHPFLLACVENICRAALDAGYTYMPTDEAFTNYSLYVGETLQGFVHKQRVLYTSGPGMVTRTFLEKPESRNGMKILYVHNNDTSMNISGCFGPYGVHRTTGEWVHWNSRLGRSFIRILLNIALRRRLVAIKKFSEAVFTDDIQRYERIVPGAGNQ